MNVNQSYLLATILGPRLLTSPLLWVLDPWAADALAVEDLYVADDGLRVPQVGLPPQALVGPANDALEDGELAGLTLVWPQDLRLRNDASSDAMFKAVVLKAKHEEDEAVSMASSAISNAAPSGPPAKGSASAYDARTTDTPSQKLSPGNAMIKAALLKTK